MKPFLDVLAGLPTTIALSFLSLAVGAFAAIPILLARRSTSIWLRAPSRTLIDIVRAVPPIVWLFIVFFGLTETGLRLSSFAAATASLGMISAAYLAEVYRGGLMAVDRGQWEAASALGTTDRHTMRYVVGPQALRVALPAMATFAIALIKDTSLAYTIGVHEVLFRANSQAQAGAASPLLILVATGGIYASLSIPTAWVTRRVEASMRERTAR